MRLLLRVLVGFGVLLLAAAGFGVARFHAQAARVHDVPRRELQVAGTPAELERGRHLATTLGGCTECHGANLSGRVMDEDALVRLTAPNITPRGVVSGYTDGDWYRAILHGVAPSGRSLLVMPAKELRTFSDADVLAMVAYVRSVPPVASELPPAKVSWLGQIVLGLANEDLWPANSIAHGESRESRTRPSGATVAHGEYLIGVCKGCHGPDLRGGLRHGPPSTPLSADISPPAMAGWSREQFERLLRSGKRRNGTEISPAMPWRALGGVTDEELTAMWLALRQ
jgi:mono/diheme cytochrome c family protein